MWLLKDFVQHIKYKMVKEGNFEYGVLGKNEFLGWNDVAREKDQILQGSSRDILNLNKCLHDASINSKLLADEKQQSCQ